MDANSKTSILCILFRYIKTVAQKLITVKKAWDCSIRCTCTKFQVYNVEPRPESARRSAPPDPVPVRPARRPRHSAADRPRRSDSAAERRSVRFLGRTLTKTNGSLGPAKGGEDSSTETDSSCYPVRGDPLSGDPLSTAEGYFSSPTDSITGGNHSDAN